MSKNQFQSTKPESSPTISPETAFDPKPKELTELLKVVESLLRDNQPNKAIEAIRQSKSSSVWARNAAAVCQLRLGNVKSAIDVYRSLVLTSNNLMLRSDIPIVFKTNFATALLKDDNISGCLSALGDAKAADHPAVGRIRTAIDRWKAGLSLWQRFNWFTGIQPDVPVVLDFLPGDLE